MRAGLVLTTINRPNRAILEFYNGAKERRWKFIVIGDKKSPRDIDWGGISFYSLENQLGLDMMSPQLCPTGHYSRKNIGYLLAMEKGCDIIFESDDDNIPNSDFWNVPDFCTSSLAKSRGRFVNIYKAFTTKEIWPRGLPLDYKVNGEDYAGSESAESSLDCPVVQCLADENPDVDSIYRLLMELPVSFDKDVSIGLQRDSYCPFNSQNTIWRRDAFPLLYLPSFCSFRMTDIWRSFVAERILFEQGKSILFKSATVWQERNPHNLMKDFEDEVPGYMWNRKIVEGLCSLNLDRHEDGIYNNLRVCYNYMIKAGYVGAEEERLVEAWIADVQRAKTNTKSGGTGHGQ